MRETNGISRRTVLRTLGGLALGVGAGLFTSKSAWAEAPPEETVDATIARLFGGRTIADGSGMMKLELPPIAENGAVVPMSVQADSPMSEQDYIKNIYIIADKNRRPMSARFSFTPASGRAAAGANLRLGKSTNVRAIAEKSDGSLMMVKQAVKVTKGGCGG